MKFRQRLERFMYGRYGTDKLGAVLIWAALILMILNSFINSLVVYLAELFLIGYSFFRMFSRNLGSRHRENQKFEAFVAKLVALFKLYKTKWKDRKTHVFTKCPYCKVNLRLPRKKGQHTVNCPKCKRTFDFKCK